MKTPRMRTMVQVLPLVAITVLATALASERRASLATRDNWAA